GTGKTACVTRICHSLKESASERIINYVAINCMMLQDPKHIYLQILSGLVSNSRKRLSSNSATTNPVSSCRALERFICNTQSKTPIVVLLDEIDSLFTRDQDVLYQLFEWTRCQASNLLLIGIANALDLTERFLPRLKLKNCKSHHVPTAVYLILCP